MTDTQTMTPLLEAEQEHMDQYTAWVRLEDDLQSVQSILAEMPGMDTEMAKAVVEEYRQSHENDRDLILALIDHGMQSMANPNGPHFAFRARNAFARFGQMIKGVTDRERLNRLLKDLIEVLSDEIAIGHPAKDAVSQLMCSLGSDGQATNLNNVIKNILRGPVSADARIVRLMELRRRHFIPTSLVLRS